MLRNRARATLGYAGFRSSRECGNCEGLARREEGEGDVLVRGEDEGSCAGVSERLEVGEKTDRRWGG